MIFNRSKIFDIVTDPGVSTDHGTVKCRFHDSRASSRRLAGRVVEHAPFSVTIDVLMKYSQSLRANGSDQGELGPGEGRELSPKQPKAYLKLAL